MNPRDIPGKDALTIVARLRAMARREFRRAGVGEAEKGNMCGFFQLCPDGGGDRRMGVAVDQPTGAAPGLVPLDGSGEWAFPAPASRSLKSVA